MHLPAEPQCYLQHQANYFTCVFPPSVSILLWNREFAFENKEELFMSSARCLCTYWVIRWFFKKSCLSHFSLYNSFFGSLNFCRLSLTGRYHGRMFTQDLFRSERMSSLNIFQCSIIYHIQEESKLRNIGRRNWKDSCSAGNENLNGKKISTKTFGKYS